MPVALREWQNAPEFGADGHTPIGAGYRCLVTAARVSANNITGAFVNRCAICGDLTDTGNRCDDCVIERPERRRKVVQGSPETSPKPEQGCSTAEGAA